MIYLYTSASIFFITLGVQVDSCYPHITSYAHEMTPAVVKDEPQNNR